MCWYLMFSIALLKRASVIYLGLSFSKFSHEEQIFTLALLELLSIAPSRETLGYISMALKKHQVKMSQTIQVQIKAFNPDGILRVSYFCISQS